MKIKSCCLTRKSIRDVMKSQKKLRKRNDFFAAFARTYSHILMLFTHRKTYHYPLPRLFLSLSFSYYTFFISSDGEREHTKETSLSRFCADVSSWLCWCRVEREHGVADGSLVSVVKNQRQWKVALKLVNSARQRTRDKSPIHFHTFFITLS